MITNLKWWLWTYLRCSSVDLKMQCEGWMWHRGPHYLGNNSWNGGVKIGRRNKLGSWLEQFHWLWWALMSKVYTYEDGSKLYRNRLTQQIVREG